MGLSIYGTTGNNYHRSYCALHLVRWLAMVTAGFPEEIAGESSMRIWPTAYVLPEKFTAKDLSSILEPLQRAGYLYPNLLLHSDAEGTYARNGRVNLATYLRGNSIRLLDELKALGERLPSRLKTGVPWEVYMELYSVVSREVEKGRGYLRFA